ncbi:hypothetical protein [Nocardia flavorosea]|uniref:hypothetical protein n=1 Tax=Nocardia flavorosea TaxID=53429 RepID=UPI002456B272|nr:hypothetical protein [Nocardia flavorosea]
MSGEDEETTEEPSATDPEAPDVAVPTWSSLNEMASSGDLVVVDGLAVYQCAEHCVQLMSILEEVKTEGKLIGEFPSAEYAVSAPTSLIELDKELAGLGTELYEIIGRVGQEGSYLNILDNILETLKTAIKAYQETEEGSARDFDLDSLASAPSGEVEIPPHSGVIHDEEFLRERLEAMESARSTGFYAEPYLSRSWNDLYNLRSLLSICGIPGKYVDLGSKWYELGDAVYAAASEFVTNFRGSTADAWDGKGAVGAVAAATAFATQLEALWPAMWRVADTHRLAAYWLERTHDSMPTVAYQPAPVYVSGGTYGQSYSMTFDLLPYQKDYKATYVAGYEETNRLFPVLPTAVFTPEVPLDDTVFDDNAEDDGSSDGGGFDSSGDGGGIHPYGGGSGYPSIDDGALLPEEELRGRAALSVGVREPDPQEAWEQARQDSAQQQLMQQGMQAMQQGLNTAGQALQDGLTAVQESMATSEMPGPFPTGGVPSVGDTPRGVGLPGLRSGGLGGGAPGGTTSSPGNSPIQSRPSLDTSKLFPRAGLPAAANTPLGGIPGSQTGGPPMGGMPMGGAPGAGGAGAGRGQGEDTHERAKYLDRVGNLDEALGDAIEMTRPVVGETGGRPAAPDQPQPSGGQRNPVPVREPRVPPRQGGQEQPVMLPRTENN